MWYAVVEGWTAPIDITLLSKCKTPAGTMAGLTAALELFNSDGVKISLSGVTTIQDSTNWIVRFSPAASDFLVGAYTGRVKLTDSSNNVAYMPNEEADKWLVRKEYQT